MVEVYILGNIRKAVAFLLYGLKKGLCCFLCPFKVDPVPSEANTEG